MAEPSKLVSEVKKLRKALEDERNKNQELEKRIKRLGEKAKHKPKTLFMDAENLDLNDSSFDAIIDNGTFHFLKKSTQKKYIENLYKTLSPQGLLFLSVFSKEDPLSKTNAWHQYFSEEEIKKLFNKFKVQKTKKLEKKGKQKKKFLIFWLAKE